MLEQQEFKDEAGTIWLNRPGKPEGAPMGLLLSIVLGVPALTLFSEVRVVLAPVSFLILLILLLAALGKEFAKMTGMQTCPQCHTTKPKGYKRCSGCGYPYTWVRSSSYQPHSGPRIGPVNSRQG